MNLKNTYGHVFDAFCEGSVILSAMVEQSEIIRLEQKEKKKEDQGTAYWSIMSVYSFESADSYMHG